MSRPQSSSPPESRGARRHLVLVGAGHAQLDLLASLVRSPLVEWDVSLVTPTQDHAYSGLLPAVIAGLLPPDAAFIPVARIAERAGMRVHIASVNALDVAARTLRLSNGDTLGYDLLSLDVGSAPAGLTQLDDASNAYAMRPFARALEMVSRIDAVAAHIGRGAPLPLAVVGAGAAGVEIALALRARVLREGCHPIVTIVDPDVADGLPLPGFGRRARRVAAYMLSSRGITIRAGSVTSVGDTSLRYRRAATGEMESLDACATAWVTGAAPHAWLSHSGLACDARGYPLANQRLALAEDGSVFGGGDCVTLRDAPRTAKAGVYAVRMAPVLANNVRAAALCTDTMRTFRPQRDFLALLSGGDGRAMLRWRGVAFESTWAHWLKMRIDHGYLERFQRLVRAPS